MTRFLLVRGPQRKFERNNSNKLERVEKEKISERIFIKSEGEGEGDFWSHENNGTKSTHARRYAPDRELVDNNLTSGPWARDDLSRT